MVLVYMLLLRLSGTQKNKLFSITNSFILSSFAVIDIFYFLFEYKFNIDRELDTDGNKRPDVFYSSYVRFFTNLWFYSNFIYYGCSKNAKYQIDNNEGLELIDIDIIRKVKANMNRDVATKNMASMFSLKGLNPVSIKNYQQKLDK